MFCVCVCGGEISFSWLSFGPGMGVDSNNNKKGFRRWNHESSGDDDATLTVKFVRTGIIIFALEVKLKTTTVCHSILVYF